MLIINFKEQALIQKDFFIHKEIMVYGNVVYLVIKKLMIMKKL